MERTAASTRDNYRYFMTIQTRWMDNDAYGHVNNVVYYSFFDTAVNRFLTEHNLIDGGENGLIGLVVGTQCQYFSPISFPDEVTVGVSVASVGRTSVRYNVAVFRQDDLTASAQGHFIHAYVDSPGRRPAVLPEDFRRKLDAVTVQDILA
ncbi:acyl-CoA thioesterase [Parapusillimonas sp. SGNA-6]|nr:acyl-CoA thioesterase [Parapusillimonas sp. SGNA-6]